jgi:hypothetical protein
VFCIVALTIAMCVRAGKQHCEHSSPSRAHVYATCDVALRVVRADDERVIVM